MHTVNWDLQKFGTDGPKLFNFKEQRLKLLSLFFLCGKIPNTEGKLLKHFSCEGGAKSCSLRLCCNSIVLKDQKHRKNSM